MADVEHDEDCTRRRREYTWRSPDRCTCDPYWRIAAQAKRIAELEAEVARLRSEKRAALEKALRDGYQAGFDYMRFRNGALLPNQFVAAALAEYDKREAAK